MAIVLREDQFPRPWENRQISGHLVYITQLHVNVKQVEIYFSVGYLYIQPK